MINRDRQPPSDLIPFRIIEGLNTRCVGQEIVYYPTIPSTMDAAREKARHGALEGTVIIAGEQTAGRGRLMREWISPQGNIALSIILKPDIVSLPYLIMVASLAAARSIFNVTRQKAQIKWPNDVLIGGKKVCGILIENELKGNKVDFSVIGIGINTNPKVVENTEIIETATSLDDTVRVELIQALLTEFENLYSTLPDGKAIFDKWRNRLVTIGKKVKATWGPEVITGIAEDVDETGALTIRGEDGKLTKVVAGDVTLKE